MRSFLLRAGVLLLVAAALVLSICCIEIHGGHDCCGEGCSICAALEQCAKRLGGAGNVGQMTVIIAAFGTTVFICIKAVEFFGRKSPIGLKVVLLN